ncbi:hypothetical protein [Chitinophaga japonensis]|uniref:Uncharacterized protein n=1 Tax=Chitinophaga japonensis TaxID=104662 RepID=A0A562SSR1_CHIJA|nr:hypothetical protein [Chitinophaga japonensis]TWI84054.1 hypothetical protein LX66_4416 [Chitinophaga japonensis]
MKQSPVLPVVPVILLLGMLLLAGALQAQQAKTAGRTEVFVLATLYKRHATTPVYNLDTLQRIIRSINPDVLVLDVSPKELEAQEVHASKIEYPAAIFPFINSSKRPAYAAEPAEPMFTEIVNEVIAAWKDFRAAQPGAADMLDRYNTALYGLLRSAWHAPADVNSAVTDEVLAGKRALEDRLVGPVEADGQRRWIANIVQVTLQAAGEHPGKRVLVLMGVENCHSVKAALAQHPEVVLADMEAWLRSH